MKINKHIFFIFLYFLITNSVAFSFTHIQTPLSGVSAFCCDSSETRMIITVPKGGLWITENGGENWIAINDRILRDQSVRILECDELFTIDSRCDTVFAKLTFSDTRVYQHVFSTDGGESWDHLVFNDDPRFSYGNFVQVDWANHNRFFHVDPKNIRISENLFASWQTYCHDGYSSQTFGFIQSSSNDSLLYIASVAQADQYPGGVYRSRDKGQTWTPLVYPNSLFDLYRVRFHDIVELSNGSIRAFPRDGFSGSMFGPHTYIEATIYSNDQGDNWIIDTLDVPQSFYLDHVIEIPNSNGVLLAEGYSDFMMQGLLYSTDYGSSFQRLEAFPEKNSCFNDIWYNPFNEKTYVCRLEAGVYSTSDYGTTWERLDQLPDFLGKYSLYTITADQLFLKGYYENSLVSYNFEDQNWTEYPSFKQPHDTLFEGSNIIFQSQDTLRAVVRLTDDNHHNMITRLRQSNDNGVTWNYIGEELYGEKWISVRRYPYTMELNDYKILAILNADSLTGIINSFDISNDLGTTWSTVNFDFEILSDIYFTNSDSLLFMSVYQEGIFCSDDMGLSWNSLDIPEQSNWHFYTPIAFNEPDNKLYVFSWNKVFSYLNGSWEELGHYSKKPRTVAMVPGEIPKFFLSYEERKLTISLDGGLTWFTPELDIPYETQIAEFKDVKYDPWRDRIWVMTGLGPMYMQVEDFSGFSGEPVQLYPADYELLTAYPNPFNESSKVVFNLNKQDEIKLDFFDITGRKVKTIADGSYQAGKHEVLLDASGLASGTYFLKLNTSDGIRTHKVTMVK